jgi:hypothetical protein
MADKKLVSLIKRLKEKTLKGTISWEKTVEEGVFQASFPDYAVTIGQERREDTWDYVFRIYNDKGELVEVVAERDFSPEDFGIRPYDFIDEIYVVARRTAMGVDQAIDSILSALGSMDVPIEKEVSYP